MAVGFDTTVEIAFNAGFGTAAASRTWTDVSDYVVGEDGVQITRGRRDEFSTVDPSRLSLTLDNTDGRFTPYKASSPYYPNVKKGRPIRVSVRRLGNLLTNPSFETNTTGWSVLGSPTAPVLSRVNTHPWVGSWGGLVTWTTGAALSQSTYATVTGLTAGRAYTFSVYAWRASGTPRALLKASSTYGSPSTVTNGFERLSVTFTASGTSQAVEVVNADATTSGQAFYFDAAMVSLGSQPIDYTEAADSTHTRFVGYIDDWPLDWPEGGSSYSTVSLTASSRLARLGKSAPLRATIVEELTEAATVYYPLTEATTAGVGTDLISGYTTKAARQGPTGTSLTDGAFTLGGGSSLSTNADDKSALFTTVSPGSVGKYVPAGVKCSGSSFRVEFLFSGSTAPSSQMPLLGLQASNPAGVGTYSIGPNIYLWAYSGGGLQFGGDCRVSTGTGGVVAGTSFAISNITASNLFNGQPHHILAQITAAGSVELYRDGTLIASTTITGAASYTWSTVDLFAIGGNYDTSSSGTINSAGLTGAIGHVSIGAALSATDVADHYAAARTAFVGETPSARVLRLAGYRGVASSEVSIPSTPATLGLAAQETADAGVVDLLQAIADTELGLIYDGPDGSLVFQGRSVRYPAVRARAFTLDAALAQIEADLRPVLDDAYLVNDRQVTNASGVVAQVTDAASVSDYGTYRQEVSTLSTRDSDTTDSASFIVAAYAQPEVRYPSVTADVGSQRDATLATAILTADLSDWLTLSNLPTQAPASSVDLLIEGYTETITVDTYTVSFVCSPRDPALVFTLQDATYGVLGTYPLGF